jgi:general secretion pathway protein J
LKKMRASPVCHGRWARGGGFTLIEVLVVLVIASMVTTILFSALSQMFRIQTRLAAHTQRTTDSALREGWFRLVMEGLYPDVRLGPDAFKADGRSLNGLTLFPLNAPAGAPAPFSMQIDYQQADDKTILHYKSGEQDMTLVSWAGRGGRFWFEDAQGVRYEQWPPPSGMWPELPSVVLLQVQDDQQPRLIPAVPMGPANPPPRPADVLKSQF